MENLESVLASVGAVIAEMTPPLLPPLCGSLLSPKGERALDCALSSLQGREARLAGMPSSRSREGDV